MGFLLTFLTFFSIFSLNALDNNKNNNNNNKRRIEQNEGNEYQSKNLKIQENNEQEKKDHKDHIDENTYKFFTKLYDIIKNGKQFSFSDKLELVKLINNGANINLNCDYSQEDEDDSEQEENEYIHINGEAIKFPILTLATEKKREDIIEFLLLQKDTDLNKCTIKSKYSREEDTEEIDLTSYVFSSFDPELDKIVTLFFYYFTHFSAKETTYNYLLDLLEHQLMVSIFRLARLSEKELQFATDVNHINEVILKILRISNSDIDCKIKTDWQIRVGESSNNHSIGYFGVSTNNKTILTVISEILQYIKDKNYEVLQLIQSNNNNQNLLNYFVEYYTNVANLLIRHGADVNIINTHKGNSKITKPIDNETIKDLHKKYLNDISTQVQNSTLLIKDISDILASYCS